MKELVSFILLIAAASIVQSTQLFSIYGIKPDIALVVLITIIPLVVNFLDYLILVLFAGILLHAPIAFLVVPFVAYFVGRRLAWRQSLINAVLIIFATVVFYLLVAPSFLFHNWSIVLVEIVYNLILGGICYFILWPRKNLI